jgi:hypothetical protein
MRVSDASWNYAVGRGLTVKSCLFCVPSEVQAVIRSASSFGSRKT